MTGLTAESFPEAAVRDRARHGTASAFPDVKEYGCTVRGQSARSWFDALDSFQIVPPVFMPGRMDKLVELGREPLYRDVDLRTEIGGFRSQLPVSLSAFGSTRVASTDLGIAASTQAGRLGIPMVIGENVVPVGGYGRIGASSERSMLGRIRAYADAVPDGVGGLAVQQSTEDADAEVWNLVYSDPSAQGMLNSGRLGFELKVGQGAKPGLGGMTVLDGQAAAELGDRFALDQVFGRPVEYSLRNASPGTLTEEILRQQIRLMRNNFPRARVWVKLHPARDIRRAAEVAWQAGADAVTVDGAEGGTGWAPHAFLDHVGLPLAECLLRIGPSAGCLLAGGRMWEGARVVKALALGARAATLGRAALLAVDEDPEEGLIRLAECLALELRMLISALGKYAPAELSAEDLWSPQAHGSPAGQDPEKNEVAT
jgi:isopentenyl diphosphate isomerase/L-lactate dehydrogenase-like FMN-dependent dehydrogenase